MIKRDNYEIQAQQAKKLFLTYDQQELIRRCHLRCDEDYFYITFLSEPYRICRKTGNMDRRTEDDWVDGNSFGEVMTILDWLCDSKPDRHITGNWVNLVTHGPYFHRSLQESEDPNAKLFDQHPEAFAAACRALGGVAMPGGDICYAIELMDGLQILLQLWHADDEFPASLRCFWDENALQYLRYETTWFAMGLVMQRLREHM